ncbi:MAG: Uma2 family endonuclease [Dyadobacter fermentans]
MKTIIDGVVSINKEYTQIINGKEINLPCPKMPHQRAMTQLLCVLYDHVRTYQLGTLYRIPYDVIFEENFNVLQPDLFFISKGHENILQEAVHSMPKLIIEVVSPEMHYIDTIIKKGIYESYGVPECWIVFPEKVCIEIYALVNGRYALSGSYANDDLVRSQVLDNLSFPVNAING